MMMEQEATINSGGEDLTNKKNNNSNKKASGDELLSGSKVYMSSPNNSNSQSNLLTSSPSYNDLVLLATGGPAAAQMSPDSDNNNSPTHRTPSSSSTSAAYIQNSSNSSPINEKVASLASSIYTELEKIVKTYCRETVKELMPIVVNVLETLDTAYQEKEEQVSENELLKDDYEKLLSQYEREKQSRKDTELKLFQSEDSFAEQKKEYEEKVKSLESIVRMIELKSKNTSDHVMRLEEKENELKREYAKLHDRYTERTKILFGNDNGSNSLTNSINNTTSRTSKSSKQQQQQQYNNNNNSLTNINENACKQLLDLLRSTTNGGNLNRSDLINALKCCSKSDLNHAISAFLASADLSSSINNDSVSVSTATLKENASSASLSSVVSQKSNAAPQQQQQQQQRQKQQTSEESELISSEKKSLVDTTNTATYVEEGNELNKENRDQKAINLQISDNFDEHLSPAYVEFDDGASDIQSNQKAETEVECEEDENINKNYLSLFNELSRENYDITELDDGADLTGMTREVANLLRENSELLQTKHALNVLKDDLIIRLDQFSNEVIILREEIKSLQTVKAALQLRISELEEEAKKNREELAELTKKQEEEDENVLMSQRKRFTRAEMARVLMERNQYKEKLMDLQEAVIWTEMMRASKNDPNVVANRSLAASRAQQHVNLANQAPSMPSSVAAAAASASIQYQTGSFVDQSNDSAQHESYKKKSPLWKFFSNLFGSSNPNGGGGISPSASSQLSGGSISSFNRSATLPAQSEFAPILKSIDKKSLMITKEDGGRLQAYGWSLPSRNNLINSSYESPSKASSSTIINMTIPVPVYCRPLFEQDNDLKLSCASTINYSIDQLLAKGFNDILKLSPFYGFDSKSSEFKSSCIWICNLNAKDSHICILDANKPSDLIHQFTLKEVKIYCISSISGAFPNEYPLTQEKLANLKTNVKTANQSVNPPDTTITTTTIYQESADTLEDINYIEIADEKTPHSTTTEKLNSALDLTNTKTKLRTRKQLKMNMSMNANIYSVDDDDGEYRQHDNDKSLSSLYPTMWLGSQEGWLFVHSSVSNVSTPIHKLKLKDAILCIVQNGGRVVVGLADGTIALFHRNADGQWDMKSFYLINFGRPHHSIRTLANVFENVWCGCRNKIFVINPDDCKIITTIEVHPRRENQVRHMAWNGSVGGGDHGVWVSIRLDPTLRLYHARTFQILQYLDIEPFITRMLGTSNLGLSLVRISSLLIGSKRLWIGTGNGVVLSIPISDSLKDDSAAAIVVSKSVSSGGAVGANVPGTVVRVAQQPPLPADDANNKLIPYCNVSETQFSFHGHRDAVKFFLNVPSQAIQKNKAVSLKSNSDSSPKSTYEKAEINLVLSGGHGYIDFRIGDTKSNNAAANNLSDDHKQAAMMTKPENNQDNKTNSNENSNNNSNRLNKNERSHLIVWQINQ